MFRWKEVEGTKKELSGLVDSEIGPSEAARTFFNRLIIQLGFQRNQRLQYDRCSPCQPYCPPRRHCLGRGHGPDVKERSNWTFRVTEIDAVNPHGDCFERSNAGEEQCLQGEG